jgi:hypothetical protein
MQGALAATDCFADRGCWYCGCRCGYCGLVLVVGNNLVGRMGVGIGLVGMEGGSRGNRFGFECCSLLE